MKEFKTESKRLLNLMVNSIYTSHEVFLRELISNASDALNKVRLEKSTPSPLEGQRSTSTPKGGQQSQDIPTEPDALGIHIALDQKARTLTVSDTGIGMDETTLERYLGTIAHSGSLKLKEQLTDADTHSDIDLIGQFGVGFYSSFMVADHVSVISRAWGSNEAYRWESNGVDGYTITPDERKCCGTDIILHICQSTADKNFERYLDQTSLQNLIKRYSNYIRYPITMDLAIENYEADSGALVRDESHVTREIINSMEPLWVRDEEGVTQEDLNELYRFEFQNGEEPLRVIRARARGVIDYDALLFIPQAAPAELYNKDNRYGLKLYSSGVLIDENCASLIPSHFRFVQGIVDTNHIDLNVSREMIQDDSRIQIMGRQLERSIIDSLKDMIENDHEGYERFFQVFGTGLKFAICSSQGTLTDTINDLLLYYSAKEKRLITLQEYLDVTENTKHTEVFYAVGADVDRLAKSPNVCAMLDRGHDVLLCPNGTQDELCFMLMGSYKGAPFHSVTSANLEIDDDKEAEEYRKHEVTEHQYVLDALFEQSSQPLVRVIASKYLTKLTQAAASIATEGIMTISMAKYIATKVEKDQINKPLYILEVNTAHVLFDLAKASTEADDKEVLKNCVTVMLGQAFLVEDIPLADPSAFNEATNALLAYMRKSDVML